MSGEQRETGIPGGPAATLGGPYLEDAITDMLARWADAAGIAADRRGEQASAFMSGYLAASRDLTGLFVTADWVADVEVSAPAVMEIVARKAPG